MSLKVRRLRHFVATTLLGAGVDLQTVAAPQKAAHHPLHVGFLSLWSAPISASVLLVTDAETSSDVVAKEQAKVAGPLLDTVVVALVACGNDGAGSSRELSPCAGCDPEGGKGIPDQDAQLP